MRHVASLMIGTLLMGGVAFIHPGFVQAQYLGPGAIPVDETASNLAFTPGGQTVDPYSGSISSVATFDGGVSGTPISGSMHIEEDRTRAVDAGGGSLTGQFTVDDGMGNSLSGSLSGQFALMLGGSTSTGQFTVTGGTGPFAGAGGSGSFVGDMSGPGGTPTFNFTASAISAPSLMQPYYGNANPGYPVQPDVVYQPAQPQVIYQDVAQPQVVTVPVPSDQFVQPQTVYVPQVTVQTDQDNDDNGHQDNGHKDEGNHNGNDNGQHGNADHGNHRRGHDH